jgi:hypothetical protein
MALATIFRLEKSSPRRGMRRVFAPATGARLRADRLVEQGKFSELMARNGVFAELNNLGSFISETEPE